MQLLTAAVGEIPFAQIGEALAAPEVLLGPAHGHQVRHLDAAGLGAAPGIQFLVAAHGKSGAVGDPGLGLTVEFETITPCRIQLLRPQRIDLGGLEERRLGEIGGRRWVRVELGDGDEAAGPVPLG